MRSDETFAHLGADKRAGISQGRTFKRTTSTEFIVYRASCVPLRLTARRPCCPRTHNRAPLCVRPDLCTPPHSQKTCPRSHGMSFPQYPGYTLEQEWRCGAVRRHRREKPVPNAYRRDGRDDIPSTKREWSAKASRRVQRRMRSSGHFVKRKSMPQN